MTDGALHILDCRERTVSLRRYIMTCKDRRFPVHSLCISWRRSSRIQCPVAPVLYDVGVRVPICGVHQAIPGDDTNMCALHILDCRERTVSLRRYIMTCKDRRFPVHSLCISRRRSSRIQCPVAPVLYDVGVRFRFAVSIRRFLMTTPGTDPQLQQ
jgi:hypothetical protein